jgi:MFS family permease
MAFTAVSPVLRRARVGVFILFMTNGMVWANIAPRFPEIRTNLGLSYGQFGLAVMFSGFGALAFGLAAAPVIRRFTSARVGLFSMIMMSAGALLAVLAPNGYLFALCFFAVGAIDSFVDVAQNAHGLRVQREYGRNIINAFHGMWSVGAVIGGLTAAAATALDISVPVHIAGVSVVIVAINVVGYRMLLKGPDSEPEPATASGKQTKQRVAPRVWLVLGVLSLIAICGAWVEDAAISWSASYLHDELNAVATVATFGFIALMAMHFVGRMIGDRLIDRYGQRFITRVGGIITAVGMGAALLWPSVPLTIIGFGLAGLGVATTIPVAMHMADELPGFRTGTGLTILSWMLRLGFMLSPVIVGAIADATSLRTGLSLVVVAGLAIAVAAQVLTKGTNEHVLQAETPEPHPAP